MATSCEIFAVEEPTSSQIISLDTAFANNMEYDHTEQTHKPTETLSYKDFDFHIVATVAEYTNNVEQHSYLRLSDEWWQARYAEVVAVIDSPDVKLSEVTKMILDKILAEFPENFLTAEQTAELSEELYMAVSAFHTLRNLFECNCGSLLCPGDCGYQQCGMCIDTCRCAMWW